MSVPSCIVVRRERPEDVETVAAVVAAAFAADATGPPVEVGLLAALRADAGWIPALSLVAEEGAAVAGHVVCTRGTCDGAPALGLGPIAVRPDLQGRGVGSALVHAVVGAAEALGETLVALLGDPGYYARFGFEPAAGLGVRAPVAEWGRFFQARPLAPGHPVGAFRYAAPFDAL